MVTASINDSDKYDFFIDNNPLSEEAFQHFLSHGSNYNYENSASSDYKHLFNDDGLFPYPMNDSSATLNHFNCSEQFQFLFEINKYRSPSQIIVPVIYIVICLVGLIGNGLVMFVISGNKEMTKNVANIYIWNLAIADTLFLVSLPFTSAQRILLYWPFGAGMCKIVEAVKYLNFFASIFFLTAMSIDRYIAVVYVVTSNKWRTTRKTFFVCGGLWLVALLMVIPLLINTQIHGDICALVFSNSQDTSDPLSKLYDDNVLEMLGYEYSDYVDNCDKIGYFDYINGEPNSNGPPDYDYFDDINNQKNVSEDFQTVCKHPDSRMFHAFIIFTFVIGFVIPFFVISICYIMIIARLKRPSEIRTRSKQAERTRRKVTRMVIILVITFFICWLPFYVWHLIQIRGITANIGVCHNVRDFTFCLGYANSCLNPILYTFLGHNFHERLRKSIAISLRSLSFTPFTKYTSNTASRAESAAHTKKMDASNVEVQEQQSSAKGIPLLDKMKNEDESSPDILFNCPTEKLTV